MTEPTLTETTTKRSFIEGEQPTSSSRRSFTEATSGHRRSFAEGIVARLSTDSRRSSESDRRSASIEVVKFHETKARISFAQEQAKAGIKQGQQDLEDLKKEISMDDHLVPLAEILSRYGSDVEKGLASEDHHKRLERFGPNALTPPPSVPWWRRYLNQFTNMFALLLQAAGVLCFIAYGLDQSTPDNLLLAVVLFVVVALTATFSYFQEAKSAALMEGFKSLVAAYTKVRRDGIIREVDARDLVQGDIVDIQAGNRVPADLRIIKQNGMKVDNSCLTGEPDPLSRTLDATSDNPLETRNLAFLGTLVVEGSGVGIVIQTGDRSVMGRIAGLAAGTGPSETTLHREIHHFIMFIFRLALTFGVVFFVFGALKGLDIITLLIFTIAIVVANVPEGLLATVTICLTLTAKRMAAKNVLVKNLEAVETLGSTTTICSDKTGTLTQNRMTVVHVMFDEKVWACDGSITKKEYESSSESFLGLFRVAALCSRSFFVNDEENMAMPIRERKVLGDASETAILKFCELEQANIDAYRGKHPKLAEIPFNSTDKFQISIHTLADKNDKRKLLVMKGATERILDRCTTALYQGEVVPMSAERRFQLDSLLLKMGGMGERVLAFAHIYLDGSKYHDKYEYDTDKPNFPLEGLTFVGFMGLLDPPRETVPGAVEKCKQAGIRVIMVTGDHPVTAKAISKQVGIITEDTIEDIAEREGVPVTQVDAKRAQAVVVPGSALVNFTEDDWKRVLDHKEVVFARTSPQQKLVIVEHCQNRGDVVAVTGDGVNDSPALKKADIGVAMGITGSDVSKEAADMILLDDNFASIVSGIEEGRLIFDNLKKSIAYVLRHLLPEIIPFLVYVAIGFPLPLSTILILFIDLGTDMFPGIAFAHEHAEKDIMQRPPRNVQTDHLVTRSLLVNSYMVIGVVQTCAAFFAYLILMNDYGFPPNTLVGMDAEGDYGFNIMFCKWDDHPTFSAGKNYTDVYNRNAEGKFSMFDTLPDDCKYFDENLAFTESNYLSGKFGDYIPYATPNYQSSKLGEAQMAYFTAIVICQFFDAYICKVRSISLFTHGVFKNRVMNYSILMGLGITCFLSYIPPVVAVFHTGPLHGEHWCPSLPWAIAFILIFDEVRRYVNRRYPDSFIAIYSAW